MNKTISILGCGWLGLALAEELIKKDFSVKASNTTQRNFEILQAKGIIPFQVRLGHQENMADFLDSQTLIIAVPSKNIEEFNGLIAKIVTSEIKNVLFVSSTSVYLETNQVVTEDGPLNNSPLVEIEELFRANHLFKATIIRFGGLFGYDRRPGNFIGIDQPIRNPAGYVNLIHRDDCVQIIEQILEKNLWNETFNACADTHPQRGIFYKKEMLKEGRTAPDFNRSSEHNYKIISSEKLKLSLGYSFKYADLMAYDE